MHDTPPLKEPLCSDLRLKGDGPEVENTLRGECTPAQGVNETMVAHILALESPIKDRLDDIEHLRMSPQDDMEDLNKTKERTSLSLNFIVSVRITLWIAERKFPGCDNE